MDGGASMLAHQEEPRLKKEDGRISFTRPARELHNLVRGLRQWPTAYIELSPPAPACRKEVRPAGTCGASDTAGAALPIPQAPRRVRVLKTALPGPLENAAPGARPGAIVRVERGGGILVQCSGCSSLWLLTVQPEGKKPVAAADFLNGLRLGVGDFLSLA